MKERFTPGQFDVQLPEFEDDELPVRYAPNASSNKSKKLVLVASSVLVACAITPISNTIKISCENVISPSIKQNNWFFLYIPQNILL